MSSHEQGLEAQSRIVINSALNDRLTEVYEAHGDSLFRLALLLTSDPRVAEDITHDAVVRVLSAHRYRPAPAELKAYLLRTIVNLCKNTYRRSSRERLALEKYQNEVSTVSSDVVEPQDSMWSLIRGLPIRQRTVIFLRYYEDRSHAQIADVMETSERAVKSLLYRALRSLRIDIGGEI